MKLTIIGTGYVGLVTGTCFAELGHDVLCIDIDEEKIKKLKEGIVPIYELGLDELITRNRKEGRLTFSSSIEEGIAYSDVIFSAVGTPEGEDHKADLRFVREVAKSFGAHIDRYKILINKSTVPVGTAKECQKIIEEELKVHKKNSEFDVVSNPEFLKEGAAVKDFLNPDRIICGVRGGRSKELMEKIYQPLVRTGRPIFFTTIESAEVIKYASNAFLATKISFVNELSSFCEKVGADIVEVTKGMGLDSRIGGRFLHAGIGYGGSCFPKDVHAFIEAGKDTSSPFTILEAVDRVNERQRERFVAKVIVSLSGVEGKRIAVWGLSFKPRTDDIRESPAVYIIEALIKDGAEVVAFDPVAIDRTERMLPKTVIYARNAYECVKGADALLICTEWDEFRGADLARVANLMRGKWIIDGRNIFTKKDVESAGLAYQSIGRQ